MIHVIWLPFIERKGICKVSLTTALIGIQPLIVFMISLLLARFIPEFDREAKDRTSILLKGLALIFIFVGLFLL